MSTTTNTMPTKSPTSPVVAAYKEANIRVGGCQRRLTQHIEDCESNPSKENFAAVDRAKVQLYEALDEQGEAMITYFSLKGGR